MRLWARHLFLGYCSLIKNKTQTVVIYIVSFHIFIRLTQVCLLFDTFSKVSDLSNGHSRSLFKCLLNSTRNSRQVYKMRKLTMIIAAVCVLFFIKLWAKVGGFKCFSSHAFSLVIFVNSIFLYRQNDLLIGHLKDDAILLLRPEYSRVLLSCANENFCFLTLAGISKRHERKNWKRCDCNSRIGRRRANGLFNNHLLAAFIILPLTLLLKPPAYSLVTYAQLLAMTSLLNFWIWSRRIPWR